MNIKAIAIDLDGTLLHEGEGMEITGDNRRMLEAAAQAGLELCIATGRVDGEIVLLTERLGIRTHRVSQNGAFLRSSGGEAWQSAVFEPELARELTELTGAPDLVRSINDEAGVYLSGSGEYREEIADRHFVPPLSWEELAQDEARTASVRISKFSVYGGAQRLRELQERALALYVGRVEAVMSQEDCLDFVPQGVTKATALRALLQRLGLRAEELAVIGDSYNDVPMLRMTPHSFAMSHAPEGVRRHAGRTAGTVAEAIRLILADNGAEEGGR